MTYLDELAAAHPELATPLGEMGQLSTKKLWHQLTDALTAFVTADPFRGDARAMMNFYEKFIKPVERRVDQLRLALLVVRISQYMRQSPDLVAAAIDFLQPLLERRLSLGESGYVVLQSELASIHLQQGKADVAKTDLAAAKDVLDSKVSDEDAVVFSHYYRAAMNYYQSQGPAMSYYQSALAFLAYTPLTDLSVMEQHALAQDLALSALVGEDVYNFGEVVEHPILRALQGTEQAWLVSLLRALHHGDIDEFNLIVSQHRADWDTQPALVAEAEQVKRKVVLLCVMELAAKRPADGRTISFEDVARETKIPLNQVEALLMRAMSLELIKGVIDQVDQVVQVTWIKPRVLDRTQIALLHERLSKWSEVAHETLVKLEERTAELFA